MKKALFLLCIAFGLTSLAQKQTAYKIVKTFHIQSPGGWDYLAINNGKLYVSHGMQVNILDEETGDSVGVIANTAGVHGIAFNTAMNRGYTSNGRTNNVTVFDRKTDTPLAQVATGENPDAILYEPYTKSIITCNGRSKNLTVLDPQTNSVVATIDVGGKPEEAVPDGKGLLYVNIEDKNEIAVVDLRKKTVVRRWSLLPGESPTGLAYDSQSGRLFAGCEKMLVVVNTATGALVDKITIGDGCDGVAFDKKNHLIFTSNGEGTLSVIKEMSANKYKRLGNYASMRGARTLAFDAGKGEVFLPTAEFEAPAREGERPKMVPGSFQVLVMKPVR